jgi:hypothetical protein
MKKAIPIAAYCVMSLYHSPIIRSAEIDILAAPTKFLNTSE